MTTYPALEWLQRRTDGESIASIAARAGVTSATIRQATDPYGPWPNTSGPTQRLEARRRRWIALRRKGIGVVDISRRDNVAHQTVSKATRHAAPYPKPDTPTPEQVRTWTAARRAGQSIAQIAQTANVSQRRVAAATKPHGPFPVRVQRIPDGIYCRADIAALLGITKQTIGTWYRTGYLPPPDFTTARGRPLWLPTTIQTWIPTSGLTACPDCGAHARQPTIHQTAHRSPTPT